MIVTGQSALLVNLHSVLTIVIVGTAEYRSRGITSGKTKTLLDISSHPLGFESSYGSSH